MLSLNLNCPFSAIESSSNLVLRFSVKMLVISPLKPMPFECGIKSQMMPLRISSVQEYTSRASSCYTHNAGEREKSPRVSGGV